MWERGRVCVVGWGWGRGAVLGGFSASPVLVVLAGLEPWHRICDPCETRENQTVIDAPHCHYTGRFNHYIDIVRALLVA